MVEVIQRLHGAGAHITAYGLTDAAHLPQSVAHLDSVHAAFASAQAVVFPMSGIDDNGLVDATFSAKPISIHARDLNAIRPGTTVFTGIAREPFEAACHRLDLHLVKLMDLDEVAILNSIPTAEGTIAMAMELMDITLHGSTAVLIGFGRCGITLARGLHALGARVNVAARRPSDLARIREMGLQPVALPTLRVAIQEADLVVNTVPHPIVTAAVIDALKPSCVIIDIASRPGGTDFNHAAERGIVAKLAPSLPGLVAPKTAGRILADTIARMLHEIKDEG